MHNAHVHDVAAARLLMLSNKVYTAQKEQLAGINEQHCSYG